MCARIEGAAHSDKVARSENVNFTAADIVCTSRAVYRPLSKHKAFMLMEILRREKVYDAKATPEKSDAGAADAPSGTATAALPGGTQLPPKPSASGATSTGARGFAASAVLQ